jgi:hypothetical protein
MDDNEDMFADADNPGINPDEFRRVLNETLDYLDPWVKDARKDLEFYALKQWPQEDIKRFKRQRRAALVFDRTRPIIDSVTGSEVTNRYEAKFKARDPDLMQPDTPYSEETSELYRYIRDNCNARHHDSAAFKDCVVTGVGATETVMDYTRNPDGEIMVKHVPILELGWDGACISPNLEDARWIIRDKWINYDELIQLFGRENIDEVISMAKSSSIVSGHKGFIGRLVARVVEDQRAGYRQRGHKYYDPHTNRIRLWEWQYRKRFYGTRIFYPNVAKLMGDPAMMQMMAAQTMAGPGGNDMPPIQAPIEDMLVPKDDADDAIRDIQAEVMQFNQEVMTPMGAEPVPSVESVEDFPEDRYYRCYMAGDKKLKEQEILTGNYTYQFMTCFEDWSEPEHRYFFGVMRPMRDPQQYANKFLSHAIHMWSSNPKGALIAEKSFFEDKEKAAAEWAQPTGFLTVRDGALQSARPRFQHLTTSVSLRGIESLLSHAVGSVSASVGVSEQYFVGAAGDLKRTAAQSIEHVTQQSLITLSNPFDSLKLYRERHARLVLGFIREYMDEKIMLRVLGPDSPVVQAIKEPDFVYNYDIVVEDAPESKSQQDEAFRMMMENNFLPQLLQMGVAPPPTIAKSFPLPGDVRQDFEVAFQGAYDLQVMQAEVEKMNLQLQMMQLQMQMQDPMGMMQQPTEGAPVEEVAPGTEQVG